MAGFVGSVSRSSVHIEEAMIAGETGNALEESERPLEVSRAAGLGYGHIHCMRDDWSFRMIARYGEKSETYC